MKLADAYIDVSTRGMGATTRKFGMLRSTVARYLGVMGVAGIIGASVKSFVSFEKKMAQVNTMLRLGQDEFKSLSDEILKMAVSLGIAPAELADAMYEVTSATFRGAEAMNILRASQRLAVAGAADMASVTKLVVGALNAYAVSGKEATQFTETLFMAVERGLLRLPELTQHFGMVLKVASQVGMTFDELNALVAILTRNSVPVSHAMTGLRAIFVQLLKPQAQALEMAEKLGITFDLNRIKTMGWTQWLHILQQKVGDNDKALAAMFGRARGISAVMTIAGRDAQSLSKELKNFERAQESLTAATEIMEETVSRRFDRLKAKFQAMKVDFGEAIATALQPSLWIKPEHAADVSGFRAGLERARSEQEKTLKLMHESIRRHSKGLINLPFLMMPGGVSRAYEEPTKYMMEYRRLSGAVKALEQLVAGEHAGADVAAITGGWRFERGPIERWAPGGGATYPMGRWVDELSEELQKNTKATEENTRKLQDAQGDSID